MAGAGAAKSVWVPPWRRATMPPPGRRAVVAPPVVRERVEPPALFLAPLFWLAPVWRVELPLFRAPVAFRPVAVRAVVLRPAVLRPAVFRAAVLRVDALLRAVADFFEPVDLREPAALRAPVDRDPAVLPAAVPVRRPRDGRAVPELPLPVGRFASLASARSAFTVRPGLSRVRSSCILIPRGGIRLLPRATLAALDREARPVPRVAAARIPQGLRTHRSDVV